MYIPTYSDAAATIDEAKVRLRRQAPAALADAPHEDLIGRESYQFLPTTEVLEAAYDSGFRLTNASQKWARQNTKTFGNASAAHLLRFQKETANELDGTRSEVVFRNGHAANASAKVFAGAFRLVCSNGLIVPVQGSEANEWSHKHTSGLDLNDVVREFNACYERADQGLLVVEDWNRIQLDLKRSEEDQKQFCRLVQAGVGARWGEWSKVPDHGNRGARDFNHVRRYEDNSPSLWGTFNRVQEVLIRGRRSYISQTSGEHVKAIRECKDVDTQTQINTALWDAATEIAAYYQG